MKPFGLILAGGQGRRMGGGNKPLRRLGDSTLIGSAFGRLAPQCSGMAISANGDPEPWQTLGCLVLADSIADAGPLAGILAGMDHLTGRGEWLLTLPGDTPFPPADLANRLVEAQAASGAPVVRAVSGGRAHPTVALWSVSLSDTLRTALSGSDRGVRRFQDHTGCVEVEWPVSPYDPFLNINTPDDLARAEAMLGPMT